MEAKQSKYILSVWDSQPAGNIRLSAAILYADAMPTKVIRVLTFLKCETISVDIKEITYYLACTVQNRQRYLETVPNMEHTQSVMQQLQTGAGVC